jgi:molybdopterin-guanine dinucleotide biosynthesis protein A
VQAPFSPAAAREVRRRPKGLEVIGGRRILDRLVDTCVRRSVSCLLVPTPEGGGLGAGLQVVPDLRPGAAPRRILTAVVVAPAPVVVVAWDALRDGRPAAPWPAGWMAPMRCSRQRLAPGRGGRFAAYGPACGPAIESALAAGDQRAIGFHANVRVAVLGEVEVGACGDPARLFFNVNSAEDLVRARELDS